MKRILLLFLTAMVLSNPLGAQPENVIEGLEFCLRQLPNQSWGVFVRPNHLVVPSERTITGSGQITLVTPLDFEYFMFKNHGGSWIENARVNGPLEAVDKAYVSFGFVADNPKISYLQGEETLLFTFKTNESFDGEFRLFENHADPFNPSNSYESNPGNDIGVIDAGAGNGLQYYTYGGNYKVSLVRPVFSSDKRN